MRCEGCEWRKLAIELARTVDDLAANRGVIPLEHGVNLVFINNGFASPEFAAVVQDVRLGAVAVPDDVIAFSDLLMDEGVEELAYFRMSEATHVWLI